MNFNKNYYKTLGIDKKSTKEEIKKAYYKLSFKHHPDKGGSIDIFNEIHESYKVLYSKDKEEYDLKSKFGNNYNEYYELFDVDIENKKPIKVKQDEILNVKVTVDDNFDGNIEYPRYVKCKKCEGTGKDINSKIEIKDSDGNILKTFEAIDGCDFCEGEGKDDNGDPCYFCNGSGKAGLKPCKTCNGEKRILGKQRLKNIKLTGIETKIDHMGHCSKKESGKVGYLLIVKKPTL
tara:strand:+ start:575 stop:1276 length:702 start_codon:yes stop_codon:yes gene_type:complete